MTRYDLAIVGGGLVGAGLATALHAINWRVAVIDARMPTSNDPRLLALNYSSCEFLKNINLWSELVAHAASIQQVHVSKRGQFGAVRLRHTDIGLPNLGHVIPAYIIEAALHERLKQQTNITLLQPAQLQALDVQQDHVKLQLQTTHGQEMIEAALVIAADGTDSAVRKLLDIETTSYDYQQSAIVTRTQLQRPHQQIAYERFNAQGAIAMLPLTGNECATIWTTSQVHAQALLALTEQDFLQQLQTVFGYRLGRLQGVTQRHTFPLRQVKAQQNLADKVFLLGNAAHTLHPIAAQGFNLALYEVATIVAGITEKLNQQAKVTVDDLQTFSARTQQQQTVSMNVSHQLAKIFTQENSVICGLLQLSMLGMDALRPAKKFFLQQLLGRARQVPPLLLRE